MGFFKNYAKFMGNSIKTVARVAANAVGIDTSTIFKQPAGVYSQNPVPVQGGLVGGINNFLQKGVPVSTSVDNKTLLAVAAIVLGGIFLFKNK